jgi:tetratricopeptide (TPR) repeat protein
MAASGNPNTTNNILYPDKLQRVIQECSKYENTALAPIALYRIGEAKLKLGDRKTAIEYCRRAVEESGTNEELAVEILERMFVTLGPNEVSQYCEQKLKTNPDSLSANFTMFNLAKIKGEYDDAFNYISKCIELTGPNSPEGLEYLLHRAELLTIAYESASDNSYLKKAVSDYESLLAKKPNNANVLNNLAYMLAESQQRLPDALEYARQALEQMPNNPNFMDTYAYVLHKNGETSKAAEILTAALQQYRQDAAVAPAEVWEHLGIVREKLGDKAQAVDAYQQALQSGAEKLSLVVRERIRSAIERLSQ